LSIQKEAGELMIFLL